MGWLDAKDSEEALAAIGDLYRTKGHSEYGESVTQLEHALQSALFAEGDGASPELIVAALLHDFGHLAVEEETALDDSKGDLRHEMVGEAALRRWFADAVTGPIRLHVAAKRYLCAVRGGYAQDLSASSIRSLALQGGVMTEAECEAFRAEEFGEDAVRLREWDDRAKIVGYETPPYEYYEPLLRSLVSTTE